MRIGLVIYGGLEQNSGGYLYDRMLVAQLRKRGHRVQIISLPWRTYAGFLADNFSRRLFARLSKFKVDLLLQDELCHPSLFLLNKKLKHENLFPIISMVHMVRSNPSASGILSQLYRWVERRYLESVDGFVFNSQHTKRLVESMIAKRKPSVVGTPGGDRFGLRISGAEIRSRARQPGPLKVLFLGNLTRNKAPQVLIEAAARISPEVVDVTLAGRQDVEPGYTKSLRRLTENTRSEGRVHFAGHLSGERLIAKVRASHILAVPSSYEGFGIAYLEGLSFGLPAIGTRSGGGKEIIRNGKNGYLIPVGDARRLARILEDLHADRQLLIRLSLAARRCFDDFPTWKQSMESIHNFLNSYNQLSPLTNSPRRKK